MQSGFDTPEALRAFKQWTDLFAKYSLPVEYDASSAVSGWGRSPSCWPLTRYPIH
jgi:hypothetical protein